jgi:hypothetical protein
MNEVLMRMEKIKSLFMETQLFCASNNNQNLLLEYLEKAQPEFRSIGYESASMSIALKNFNGNPNMLDWLDFAHGPAKAHQAQVYVGLGWAIAKLNLPFLSTTNKIELLLQYHVADGCGYYDGCFRQRQSIANTQIPDYVPAVLLPLYDQGIGRSLWYMCNAEIEKIKGKIETFTIKRQASLWRGIGIAVAYVGGCNDIALKLLIQAAKENDFQLTCGAALAVKSRVTANTVDEETNSCSQQLFALTTNKLKLKDAHTTGSESNYYDIVIDAGITLPDEI